MIDKKLLERFFKEFQVPFQEEDASFIFANPSDAAKSLIRARNWTGTLTELLVSLGGEIDGIKDEIRSSEDRISRTELRLLSNNIPTQNAYTKNKEIQKAYIWSKASQSEVDEMEKLVDLISLNRSKLNATESDRNQVKQMLESLTKSTDWLSQYINWVKFEAKNLND